MIALVLLMLAVDPQLKVNNKIATVGGHALTFAPSPYAYFELCPADGHHCGSPCTGTAPTGARLGETVVFARASLRACMTGGEFSLIANGSLVTLSSGQIAVMPGGDGSGPNGISIWDTRTTRMTYSEQLDNGAVWVAAGTGVAAPTITANYAVAPDGNTTAERFVVPATTTGQDSIDYNPISSGIANVSSGFFVRGTSGSGTTDVCGYQFTAVFACVACNFVSTSWTRCDVNNYASVNPDYVLLGNETRLNGGTARSGVDFLGWGGQSETDIGDGLSPYMKTTSAGVTRAAEVAYVTLAVTGNIRSFADTWVAPVTLINGATMLDLYTDGSNDLRMEVQSSKLRCSFKIGGSTTTLDSSGTLTVSAPNRVACFYDGTNMGACIAGVCNTASHALTLPATATVYLGARQDGTNYANGVHTGICIDNASASRCQ